jgi:hypothetical protein
VRRHHPEFRARGVRVAAIGQGTGAEATAFCRSEGVDYPCLGDPGKQAYAAFGLLRDGWWNVTARPFLEQPKLAISRIRNASLKGSLMRHTDVLQLGGVAIVDGEGVLRYLHVSRKTDDLPPTPDLLAELDRLGLSSRPAERSGTGASLPRG